jgi:LmbE family N-acetylglucosaminyl deacetylase
LTRFTKRDGAPGRPTGDVVTVARRGAIKHEQRTLGARLLREVGSFVAVAATALMLVLVSDGAATPSGCVGGSLYIAAHEDDPLLFMMPDIGHDIAAGRCVRVVILTAGDAGLDQGYWQRREAGLAAALAVVAGLPDRWRVRDAGVPEHPAPLLTLTGNPRLSLVFLQLPDGRSDGSGFDGRGSMKQLWENTIPTLTSLPVAPASATYHPSSYTRRALIDALLWLMTDTKPRKIGIQDYVGSVDGSGDHSDHRAGARFAVAAAQSYRGPGKLIGYIDYQILGNPPNLDRKDAAQKQAAWFAYLPYDNQVSVGCRTVESCMSPGNYGNYWSREYLISPAMRLPSSSAR